MAANKSDLFASEAVPEEKARNFAKEIGAIFKLTSACTSAGVEKLFYNVGCRYLDPNFKDDDDGNSDSNKTNEEKKEEVTNNQNQPSEKEKSKEPVKEEKKEKPKEKPKETENKDQAKGMKLNKVNTKPKKKKKCC